MIAADQIAGLRTRLNPRSGPLIITVFGDAIAPRCASVWLGSLISMMAELGQSERLVRTGVYRLAREGWLESQARGRRSYYALTPNGRDTFAEADARIYASHAPDWNGQWTLVNMLPAMPPASRQQLREALKWRGFGQLSPTLMVKPQRQSASGHDAIAPELSRHGPVNLFTARLDELNTSASLKETASAAWNLADINSAYVEFIDHFSNFKDNLPVEPADCFALRSLLIHEYRRTLLKDPQLPSDMLPADWSGEIARKLVTEIYLAITQGAETFITSNLKSWSGKITPANGLDRTRFA